MLTRIQTLRLCGIDAIPVTVETEISNGIGIHLVGLSDNMAKETLLRSITALVNLDYKVPGKKIVINISPSSNYDGSGYDLAIALGILAASGQESLPDREKYIVLGELGLDGQLRNTAGWLQAAELAKEKGLSCILPSLGAKQAARVLGESVTIYGVEKLEDVIAILNGVVPENTAYEDVCNEIDLDGQAEDYFHNSWNTIHGNKKAKRALKIAAAGNLPIMLMGVPGSGKLELARALGEILPQMSEEEILEVQRIYSAANIHIAPGVRPNQIISGVSSTSAIIGHSYGAFGKVTLAHNGILFCNDYEDLLSTSSREALRTAFEDKHIMCGASHSQLRYPSNFFLVLGANPCPCGYHGIDGKCTCSQSLRKTYLDSLSGPLMDDIVLHVETEPDANKKPVSGDSADMVAARVLQARETQKRRQNSLNCELSLSDLCDYLSKSEDRTKELVEFAKDELERCGLDIRNRKNVLKIARTIADLEGCEDVREEHISEAVTFRIVETYDAA